tara:strand:+ start:2039 stop:2587 length:549 start_codon:yes stop_codon:yes gene_type:complete
MYLRSLEGCRLAIGSYPSFDYDARGGGGKATVDVTQQNNVLNISFLSEAFSIPPLTSQTTKFLSLPIPAGLKIVMAMDKLEGTLDTKSGEIFLNFEARFVFSIFSIFHFPDLIIKTSLETGKVKSNLFEEEGLVLQKDGKATLVGIALVPTTKNKILDAFLGLPNEALAVLQCVLKKSDLTA